MNLIENEIEIEKYCSLAPKNESGLIQMIRMGKSIRHRWVYSTYSSRIPPTKHSAWTVTQHTIPNTIATVKRKKVMHQSFVTMPQALRQSGGQWGKHAMFFSFALDKSQGFVIGKNGSASQACQISGFRPEITGFFFALPAVRL